MHENESQQNLHLKFLVKFLFAYLLYLKVPQCNFLVGLLEGRAGLKMVIFTFKLALFNMFLNHYQVQKRREYSLFNNKNSWLNEILF